MLEEAIREYLTDHDIEAVLTEYGASGVEMMNICDELGIPLIVHFHGYDAYRQDMMESFGVHYPEMFRKASAIVAVSNHMRDRLKALGAPEQKLRLNHYGPDAKYFKYNDAGKNPPVIVAVGRFAETKSPHLTILAFKKVVDAFPEARLIMAGHGHLWEACRILAKSLGIDHAVQFKGVLSHGEVGEIMAKARMFVQHSITTPLNDTEGTPLAVLEASAAGLPVVSTLHAGIPDVVIEGESGLLVNEGDIDGMAENMLKLLQDQNMASRLGKAGHERIKSHFTLERHIHQLEMIIEEAIKAKVLQTA